LPTLGQRVLRRAPEGNAHRLGLSAENRRRTLSTGQKRMSAQRDAAGLQAATCGHDLWTKKADDSCTSAFPRRGGRQAGAAALSLLAGLRTEEARALRWSHVDLDGDPAGRPTVPPHVAVWRSVRVHGETKTERSRRTLALPQFSVQALRALRETQAGERLAAGDDWQDTRLVFTTHHGAALDAGNVRKMFKRVCTEADIGDAWTPRELQTSLVSLMSHHGSAPRRSPASSGTPPPAPPRSSTAANYGRSSPPAPRSWTTPSQQPNPPRGPRSRRGPAQATRGPLVALKRAMAIQPIRQAITHCKHSPTATSSDRRLGAVSNSVLPW